MDHRRDVTNSDDIERQPPPIDQAPQGSDEQDIVWGDFDHGGNLFAEYNFNFETADDNGVAQVTSGTQDNPYFMPVTGDSFAGPSTGVDSDADAGYYGDYANVSLFNDSRDSVSTNTFSHVAVPGKQQTNANSGYDPRDLDRHLPFPQSGSGNPTDRSTCGYMDDSHNLQGPTTYPGPPNRASAFQSAALPAMDVPKRPRRRRRPSTDSSEAPEALRMKKQCEGCDKTFYTSKDQGGLRCSRCYDKHVKHTAGHTTYVFDPEMTIEHAWHRLYPNVEPLAPPGDDVDSARTNEQDYIRRLIEAVSLPYTSDGSGSKEDQQRIAQQSKLNKKPFDSAQYRDDLVNARIRFLFHIALSYHAGGPSLYDTGGDNSGYGEDKSMKFSERMERIMQLLTFDKDIAMDVIEGRGVTALVHNPNKYERRKRDNKKSNDTKQDLQEKGKQLDMLKVGSSASPAASHEVAPGQHSTSLQARLAGKYGESYDGFDMTASPGPSTLRTSMQSVKNADEARDFDEYQGYVPAQFD